MTQPVYTPAYEERDGLLIDLNSGEIIGITAPDGGRLMDRDEEPARFTIDDEEKANWVLGKILKRDATMASVSLTLTQVTDKIGTLQQAALAQLEADPEMVELRAIERNCDSIMKRAEIERQGLIARFEHDLKAFAQRTLDGLRSRTLKLPFGSISLRKTGGNLQVVDDSRFCDWALSSDRLDLVKVAPRISNLCDADLDKFMGDEVARVQAGLGVVEVDDKVTITTGVAGR